jgi:hypothetical protein
MPNEPYLRRVRPAPDTFIYEVPDLARNRFMYQIEAACNDGHDFDQRTFESFARNMLKRCVAEVGGFIPMPVYSTGDHTIDHFRHHFSKCDTDYFLTMIEWLFHYKRFSEVEGSVDQFNYIFRTEGIGFALTPYSFDYEERPLGNGKTYKERLVVTFPEIIKKTNELVHSTVVIPTLQLLGGKHWNEANEEMLKAHKHLKEGNYREAINQAGCCLESVLKIICDKKGWPFVADKDTINPLLQAAHKGGLFESPYIDALQQTSGKIRNTWGGHGKAKTSHGDPSYEMAEHMINVTSSHVMFLVKQAKM